APGPHLLERPGPGPVVPEVRTGAALARRLLRLRPRVDGLDDRLDRHVRMQLVVGRDRLLHPRLDAGNLLVAEPPERQRDVPVLADVVLAAQAAASRPAAARRCGEGERGDSGKREKPPHLVYLL